MSFEKPQWLSEEIPITDEQILQNAEKSTERQIIIGEKPRAIGTWLVRAGVPAFLVAGGLFHYADTHPEQVSDFLTDQFGRERALWAEEKYFTVTDKYTKFRYQLGFGPEEQPFEIPKHFITNEDIAVQSIQITPPSDPLKMGDLTVPVPEIAKKPKPFIPPDTHLLLSDPHPGEGSWSAEGLPTTEETLTMAKTYIRPDAIRPYASVGVIAFDNRRVNLNMVGGAKERGIGGDQGPGQVPQQDRSNLLVVLPSGFKIDHARKDYYLNAPFVWGAYLDGVEYATLQPGMGSVVVYKDGSMKIGVWGEGDMAQRTDDMVAVRQNGKLMIQDGELTPAIKNQGDLFLWGKLTKDDKPGEIITARSAIGVSKEGYLMIAASTEMSALNFALGFQAAGAQNAIQLDINYPWVQIGVVSGHTASGEPILSKFMDRMHQNGSKFLEKPQERDFMYITRDDDSRFIP